MVVQGSEPLIASLIAWGVFLIAQLVKNLPAMQETYLIQFLGWEDLLEKG